MHCVFLRALIVMVPSQWMLYELKKAKQGFIPDVLESERIKR